MNISTFFALMGPVPVVDVDLLIVGGAGRGGNAAEKGFPSPGKGGGGGESIDSPDERLSAGAYSVVVGAGGSPSSGAGSVSSFDTLYVAAGGGAGSDTAVGTGGGTTSGVRYKGANGQAGNGHSSSISGTARVYGSGGGGGAFGSSDEATGSPGGTNGGTGGSAVGDSISGGAYPGTPGTANLGGGGGGGGRYRNDAATQIANAAGGDGGSGVVIVRYLTGSVTGTGGTITTDGAHTVHTFTTSGILVLS